MATPIVTKIDQASKAVWPPVQAAVAVTMRTLAEMAQISEAVVPKVEEYVSRGGQASVRRRKICEETIWALVSLGWLRTGAERDAILAAKAYVDAILGDDAPGTDLLIESTEDALVHAVNALPEYMTTPNTQEAAS